ncbi:MAG: 2-C-methyl-D-erythritol 4-phosphate cytidylyltransferase [Lachnospiraceae bacterium]|uniref:2-C-methyl-D-erythritol 4-phosphate cytidylyltransferase n=1 Tax=Parablautia sp. Marseille-Q6255 TaxID=3039593 RepID=UPI0024BD563C|nr:2-C-methyl-D-erythritol 4-phosphate cytidylyltransferase [Parablautia sp. Marseille-Q6255]
MRTVAIVLAGGSGSRMKSSVKKQYMLIGDKPVLYYSLRVFQDSSVIDEIILVCGREEVENCRAEIVEKYDFTKVSRIIPGGKERYHSVYEGLKAAVDCDYVMIHDGARPFVDEQMLERIWDALPSARACTVGMPVKDTIKRSDPEGFVEETLPREKLWLIQTPQAFEYRLIRKLHEDAAGGACLGQQITDDAMLVECLGKIRVKLIEGSYQNIKITTPDDLLLAQIILGQKKGQKKG